MIEFLVDGIFDIIFGGIAENPKFLIYFILILFTLACWIGGFNYTAIFLIILIFLYTLYLVFRKKKTRRKKKVQRNN